MFAHAAPSGAANHAVGGTSPFVTTLIFWIISRLGSRFPEAIWLK